MSVLAQASDVARRKWRSTGGGWKGLLAVFIGALALIGLAYLVVWSGFRLLKGLSTGIGSGRNMDLYFPRMSRRR